MDLNEEISATDGLGIRVNTTTWNHQEILELHDSFRNEQGRMVIARIAERSLHNEVATFGELMEISGLNNARLRAQLGWFAKKSKAVKGVSRGAAVKGKDVWPLVSHDAGSYADRGKRNSYRMPKPIAEWWLGT